MKKAIVFLVLLLGVTPFVYADNGEPHGDEYVNVTQNGNHGELPAWRVQNISNTFLKVWFVQPDGYQVTLYMPPNTFQLVGKPESFEEYNCTVPLTPMVRGTTMGPVYSTPLDQIFCSSDTYR